MNSSDQQVCIGAHTLGGDVMLDPDERRRHLYVIGQTGDDFSCFLISARKPYHPPTFACFRRWYPPARCAFRQVGAPDNAIL